MGSVFVTWSGRCDDRNERLGLFQHICALGELSHGFFPTPPPLVVRHEERHSGQILLERGVLGRFDDVADFETTFVPQDQTGGLRITNPLVPDPVAIEDTLLAASAVTLHGVEFKLYDGRSLYADDRVSFVFAQIEGHEEFGWRLVKVEERASCAASGHPALAGADLYLTRPRIHLRTYCEDWIDWLLAAVRIFFVRDLEYWRYEPFPNFSDIKAQIAELDSDSVEMTVFGYLHHWLGKEVEAWRERAAEASDFWGAVRAAQAGNKPG